MSPSPPTRTPRAKSSRRHGIAWFATIAGGGAALLVFGLSPTTALTGTSPAPVAPADSPLSDTSQVTSPTAVLQAPVAPPAVAPADPVVAAAAPAVPVAQPKAQGNQPAAKAPEQATEGHPMSPSADACGGLQAAVDAFLMHLNAAHLETSPGQQVTDVLAVDQYVLAHTVLIENMLKPLVAGSDAALGTFLQHVYAAHLEASPGQQVADVAAVDQYVKTHTVLIENMLKPLAGSDTSSC